MELLRGAPELVVYGREAETMARVRSADRELAPLARRDALLAGLSDGLSILIAGATAVGVLAVAVAAHAAGALDRVMVATLALLAVASFDAVAPLPEAARELSANLSSARRLLELTERQPAVRDPPSAAPPVSGIPSVALEGVSAGYGGGDGSALIELDLRIEPGRRCALVGASGAGKTTVTSLLLGFLDPEVGRVIIAERDLREYSQVDVRGTFALAGQEAHLFNSTIRANLLLGRPGASDVELTDALRRARLEEWVAALPDGLETIVGEEGTSLSGGQRQRLIVARALIAHSPVLILDEPTAHIDPEAARELLEDVFGAARDRSVLRRDPR